MKELQKSKVFQNERILWNILQRHIWLWFVFILPKLTRRRKSKLSLTISKQWCTTEYFKWITIIIRFFVFFCLSRNCRARNCRYFDILHTKCLDARYLSSAKESILKKNPISIEIHTHCTKACTLAKNEEAKLYM